MLDTGVHVTLEDLAGEGRQRDLHEPGPPTTLLAPEIVEAILA